MTAAIPLSWLILPVLAFLIYIPALNGIPIFDDKDVLGMLQVHFRWTRQWFRSALIPLTGRPITSLSYAVQAKWPGTFRSLHAGNILIHALNGVLVERLALALGWDAGLALIAAVVFVAHPFAANTVGYITGRASMLGNLGGLAALTAILSGHPVLGMMCWILAIYAKEDSIGYFLWILAGFAWRGDFGAAVIVVALVAAGIVWKQKQIVRFMRINGDVAMDAIGLPVAYPQPQHAITVAVETVFRIPMWNLGLGQSPYHGSGVKVPGFWRWSASLYIGTGILMAMAVIPALRIPLLLTLAGPWMVYVFCPLPDQLMEYRNYSAVAGFALLGTPLLVIHPVVAIAGIGYLAARSAFHAYSWSEPLVMWDVSARHASGDASRSLQELGAYSKMKGDKHSAELYLRDALQKNPRLGPAMNNLGWTLIETGKKEEGIGWLVTCAERCPGYALAWEDLGIVREQEGQLDEAEQYYARAMSLDPRMERSANRTGLIHFYKKNLDVANAAFEKAEQIHPNYPDYLYNRAIVLKQMGKMDEAVKVLARVPQPIRVTPNMIRLEFAQ